MLKTSFGGVSRLKRKPPKNTYVSITCTAAQRSAPAS